jgi:hypothetical protein
MRRLFVVIVSILSWIVRAQTLHVGAERRTAIVDDGPAALMQSNPAVATDGRDFLVLWDDDRFETLCAARVSGSGELLDTGPERDLRRRRVPRRLDRARAKFEHLP